MAQQYFYDKQIRRYIQQFIRLFSGFNVQMGKNDNDLPIYQQVPVRYGDINRMAAHITRENSENIINTVPFISCYVTSLDMFPERRTYQDHVDKVQVNEKKYDETTGKYVNELGNQYTIERYAPVPYMLVMNCDVWTSNTDQKLQLMEQILVLFNPTLDIRTNDSVVDWTSLSHVELTNTSWSTRSVGSSIDDIIDVATLTFNIPVYINPPAKLKQQKLIHTIISELYSLDEIDLENFKENKAFDPSTLKYTVVTYEDKKVKYENGNLQILNNQGSNLDSDGLVMEWDKVLLPFGVLRDGISQLRLRKGNDINDTDNDIIGRLNAHPSNANLLTVTIDNSTLPTNTLTPIDAILDPSKNYPGDGTVPNAISGQRYMLTSEAPINTFWTNIVAHQFDIIQYNGTTWTVSFDASAVSDIQYVTNVSSDDQLEWNSKEWVNSYEGTYNPGYWRIYL
jgi:hypothetical protein